MKSFPDSVKSTGARRGDVLVGIGDINKGLKIRIESDQQIGAGGRIKGRFVLLDAGTGDYSMCFKEYEGMTVTDVKHILDDIASKGYTKVTHPFNMNMMECEKHNL